MYLISKGFLNEGIQMVCQILSDYEYNLYLHYKGCNACPRNENPNVPGGQNYSAAMFLRCRELSFFAISFM